MAATLLRRALHLRRVLPSPSFPFPPPTSACARNLLCAFTTTTTASQQNAATVVDPSSDESRRRLVDRLVYRSKQRGFLELIHVMDEADIRAFLPFLDLDHPDLWKWLSGQEQPPEDLNSNPVFTAIKSKITNNLAKHSSPETRSTPGQPRENPKPDMWKWLSGQEQPPEHLNSDPDFTAIKSKITNYLAEHSSPETRSTPGKDGPKYGNQ